MKKYLILLFILSTINIVFGQTISGELYDGGLYGSDASSDMTTTLTASSQYSSGSNASPTIFVYRILQTEWDASGVTSVSIVDNPLNMGNSSGGPDGEWDDGNGYHYLYYSAGIADWDLNTCPTTLGSNSTYLSLKFNGLSAEMTVYMTLLGVDPVNGSKVNLVSENQLTSVDNITIGSPLFISIVDFKASKYNSSSSYLSWTGENEVNFDRFEIQRSINGRNWVYAGTVNSYSLFRSSDYSFIDKDVYDGVGDQTFYYRLKLIDKDGGYRFSKIRDVSFEAKDAVVDLEIYPNPSSEKVFFTLSGIDSDSDVNIDIFDINGKIAYRKNMKNLSKSNLLLDNTITRLQSGMYNVIISDKKGHRLYKKLILAR